MRALQIDSRTLECRHIWLALLICLHIVICCISLLYVADLYLSYQLVGFDKTNIQAVIPRVALFAAVSVLFVVGRFGFGYFVAFYFYTMILGFLWFGAFSKFHHDHTVAAASIYVSGIAFFLPAIFITSPIQQRLVLSTKAVDYLLSFIFVWAVAVLLAGAFYNFRLIGIADIYDFRSDLEFPAWLGYAMGTTSNVLVPFAFAYYVARRNGYRATIALLILLLFYPITLSKLALFAPFWLLFLTLLSRFFEVRTAVVLSLLIPTSIGIILIFLLQMGALSYQQAMIYFGTVNFRMIAFPSIALDLYSDFFSTHDHTYFCQISLLKKFINCPYVEPLSIVMAKTYHLGNLNASLFATEGIASVGPALAPLAAFACGLVISLGNRLSAGLPPRFILLSSGLLPTVFLNTPLSTNLLTNGVTVMFVLWYITPRTMSGKSEVQLTDQPTWPLTASTSDVGPSPRSGN